MEWRKCDEQTHMLWEVWNLEAMKCRKTEWEKEK